MNAYSGGTAPPFLSGPDFAAFRRHHGLDVDELARWLGISEDELRDMEKRGAPKIAALALAALDYGRSPWTTADIVPAPVP